MKVRKNKKNLAFFLSLIVLVLVGILIPRVSLSQDNNSRQNTQSSSDILSISSTVLGLTTTGILSWIQIENYYLSRNSRLRFVAKLAKFYKENTKIHLEVPLFNSSVKPTFIEDWQIDLYMKGRKEPLESHLDSYATSTPTQEHKVPSYIGGKGWLLNQNTPIALSLVIDCEHIRTITDPKNCYLYLRITHNDGKVKYLEVRPIDLELVESKPFEEKPKKSDSGNSEGKSE